MGMDTTLARREERCSDHRKWTNDRRACRRDYQRNTNGRCARRRNDQERPTVAAHAGATTKGTTNSRRARRRDDQGNDQRPPRTPARRPGETNGRRAHRRDDQERPTVAAHTSATTKRDQRSPRTPARRPEGRTVFTTPALPSPREKDAPPPCTPA